MHWQLLLDHRFKLAEGAHWDTPQQALYWVDIAGFKACRLLDGNYQEWQLAEPVSAFIPCDAGDALVTLASGVYRLDLASPGQRPALRLLCRPDPVDGNRANEARCDANGHLWLGSMQNNLDPQGADVPLQRRSGGLFRIGPQADVTPLLADMGIVNTLLWGAEGDTLFSADTLDGVIYRYAIDAQGQLRERQVWAAEHPRGAPDGAAMDAQGYIWNARWGGQCLLRFAPDGCLDRAVELPVSHPTSCVFGGPELQTLYVTSAAPADASGQFDGALIMAQTGFTGLPCNRFAG